jgi:hypothetical protein
MNAIFKKELRQLAPWAAAMLLATVSIAVGVLCSEFAGYREEGILTQEMLIMMLFASGSAALILGLLQTILEVRRDQWAFLMHRGVSATRIFVGKAAAAMVAYALVTLVPVLVAALWCAVPGVYRYPFSWYQTLPMLVTILASSAFYFAVVTSVVWKGPWHVSRLLPLTTPVLLLTGVVGFTLEFTEYVPPILFLATGLAVAIHAVAAWGVFIRSGEAPGRPRAASACLGVPVFASVLGLLIALFSTAAAGYELYLRNSDRGWPSRPYTSYTVSSSGHILRLVHGPVDIHNGYRRPLLSITDLDEPDSQRYAPLVGKSLSEISKKEGVQTELAQIWDPLATAIVRRPASVISVATRRVLEPVSSSDWRTGTDWIFSTTDGWLYGYRHTTEMRFGREERLPPRLEWIGGPDGFTDATARPSLRFSNLLADSAHWSFGSWTAWPALQRAYDHRAGSTYLLCDDGLYDVDFEKQTVRRVLAAREGHTIRGLAELGEEAVAVVYEDAISVHAAVIASVGTRRDWQTKADVEVALKVPGELLYLFPIPAEIAPFEWFLFGRVSDSDWIIFQATGSLTLPLSDRIVEMKLDGTVVRSRDLPRGEDGLPEALPPLCGAALFVPAAPLTAAALFDSVRQVAAGTGPGLAIILSRRFPALVVFPVAILLATALACAALATWTARRYGFDRRTRRAWQWTAFLLGPAGLVTLWFLRDWPAREQCRSCGARRPVTLDACPFCRQPAPSPVPNGTEILVGIAIGASV